ncbi:hypothetical protein AAE478_006093 [Parahypoxylon ruwenzoriense]
MAKWKELGEVPDSDDESTFDSSQEQESEHELPQAPSNGRVQEGLLAVEDLAYEYQHVWDIPSSSQISGKGYDADRPPSPLPQAPTVVETVAHYLDSSSPLSSPLHESQPETTTGPFERWGEETEELGAADLAPIDSPDRTDRAVLEVADIPDDDEGPVPYERSLRPRKPIQEHPYLLESAQYSKTLRSHGVRPLKVQIEEAARRRQEEDSQEQEYDEDSQSTVRGFAQEDSGESQGMNRPSLLNDTADEEELRPAGRKSPPPTRENIRPLDLLRSSQNDEDEFPDPADIHKWELRRGSAATAKRRASPKASEKQKLPRLQQPVRVAREDSPLTVPDHIFDIPPSPPQTSPNFCAITPVTATRRSKGILTLTPKPSSTISSRNQSPTLANKGADMIDLTMAGDGDETSNEQDAGSSTDSESDSEMVRSAMRRIRGVLPASWLRLDQQSTHQKNKKVSLQQSPDLSPERTQRRGVAQRRQTSPKPGIGTALFLDDSDDDNMTPRFDDINEIQNDSNYGIPIFENDAGSVIEEDHIDYMLSGNKRASVDAYRLERPRKRRKNQQSIFKGQAGQPKRQQRITGLLNKSKSTSVESSRKKYRPKSNLDTGRRTKEFGRTSIRTLPPPPLSILDVVEPGAPPFIRIAARTASRRLDRGRSSPSKKRIALGTRQDNIDATSVLRDWNRGRIQPRASSSSVTKPRTDSPKPLQPVSHNSINQLPRTYSKTRTPQVLPSSRFLQPRRMVKQASIDNFVTIEPETTSMSTQSRPTASLPKHSPIGQENAYSAVSRPAQLEMVGEKVGRHAFDARKRALDALYRKSRRALYAPVDVRLERLVGSNVPAQSFPRQAQDPPTGGPRSPDTTPIRERSKFRKHFRPRHVDTTAPQYAHANDPLPREVSPVSPIIEVIDASEPTGKLLGLGPFGTYYTQHFEIFPLDLGVFFHECTLLGSGRLAKALGGNSRDALHRSRSRCSFVLDEKALRWGQWEAQTSSEFGIVFDWIMDYFYSDSPGLSNSAVLVQATEFVLDYLQDSISFSDQENEKHFAGRALEVLRNFAQRLENLPSRAHDNAQPLIDVLSRGLIISLQVLRICKNLNQLSETFQLEEVIKMIAKGTARKLLETELVDIRNLYHELQRMSFRERGIRNEHYSIICWVILIRVLEETRIPKASFWDIVSSVMQNADINLISDAHTFESIWYNLFTLLPLGEFNNAGVAVPGTRHMDPLEGWILPQKLLKRVFQLYESNSQQAPSFNDYCRGIVGRCHYLVEQWGWRKSNGIIGTIFDFFAARGLSHLRNEEVYRSPEFLGNLTGSPPLTILPEDKCFHIFLKLLALSIKRLKSHGLTKDVRNMVARVLPNHNRQYDKEKGIHETELAALRNHHDLLCTLFWAAPPGLRPSVQTIEKLVVPASSHKEACLISLRAWSQLSRFVISSDEDNASYKPFADWQKNIFQQVMEQYLSAESDIQQQLARMSKDASKDISRDMVNAVIKLNKKGAMDILHFSMKAFLDVVRHARTLSAASFALNHYQVFSRFPYMTADFDWGSLRAALDTLDCYVARIETFLNQGPTNPDHSWHGEDAIMLLEHKIAAPFFSMARTVTGMDFREDGLSPTSNRAICVEQIVSIAGRLAARLIHARLSRVSQFFMAGKYNMFPNAAKAITSPSRKYRVLFLSMLIEQSVDDFKDLGGTITDLFLMELVKPFNFLAYENRLALAIRRHDDPYLKEAVIEAGNSPDYNSNQDLFGHIVAMMRKTLRFAGTSRKQQLQSQFTKAMKSTMDQIKLDLKLITLDSREHANYIEFVRSIITVIRSQDLCPVDPYFYQISREYSPSSQDPRLQIAGILSWGLKLEEGDSKAVPGLFYLLFPNFKLALANGKLADERLILQQGMGNSHVLSFMLSRMFPAIIKTATQMAEGWVLVDAYVEAFNAQLAAPCVHRAIDGDSMEGILVLLQSTLTGLRHLRTRYSSDLPCEHVYSLIRVTVLLNILSPSVTAYMINEPASRVVDDITVAIEAFTDFTRTAEKCISDIIAGQADGVAAGLGQPLNFDLERLFEGIQVHGIDSPLDPNEHVSRFANHMIRDIKDNWVSDGSIITVRGPSRPQGNSSTQSGQGTRVPKWSRRRLMEMLQEQLREWNYAHDLTAVESATLPPDDFVFY